jgi:hypothetical protein
MRSLPATILARDRLVAGVARAEDTPPVTVPPALEARPQADKDLETAIGRAIEDDQRVNAMQTKVAVKGGHVTLTGTARTSRRRRRPRRSCAACPGSATSRTRSRSAVPASPARDVDDPEVPAAH